MRRIPLLTLVLGAFLPACAAVDGVVQNGTTGKPQPGATVTLMQLSGGMTTVGSLKSDAAGRFQFPGELDKATYLIQALYDGVTYNQMLSPGAASSGIELLVYNGSAKSHEAKVVQHMVLLEPGETAVEVNQSVIFNNTGKVTYQDPDGTFRFTVPAAASNVQVRIIAPQGMPITRAAEKGRSEGEHLVRYPIKPGETRIDVNYSVPGATSLEGRILHGGGPVRFIAPKGVTLVSPALTDLGPEPRTQATVYELKGNEYAIQIQGTGTLRAAAGAETTSAPEEDPSGGINAAKPLIYNRLNVILGFVMSMLAIGFILLLRAQRA